MAQFAVVFIFFSLALGGFWLALHFSKYKKGSSGCCGGTHCSTNIGEKHKHHNGGSCHREKVAFVDNYGKQNA